MGNLDVETVEGFGVEWNRFDQTQLSEGEDKATYEGYFAIFPWQSLPPDAEGFDLGCGSGRWAKHVAPRVGKLHCIEPSSAVEVARRNLHDHPNTVIHRRSVDSMPLADGTMDFGYSLGVLHHIPDTTRALQACTAKLKPGAPFLLYLYYAMENRPRWYRSLWRATDLLRSGVSRSPHAVRHLVSDAIALSVYWPLARTSRLMAKRGIKAHARVPLAAYGERSLYAMRTDSLDRFGTRLEQRFTRDEIAQMMRESGLTGIRFSDEETGPFWCAVGTRRDLSAADTVPTVDLRDHS